MKAGCGKAGAAGWNGGWNAGGGCWNGGCKDGNGWGNVGDAGNWGRNGGDAGNGDCDGMHCVAQIGADGYGQKQLAFAMFAGGCGLHSP